MARSNTKRERRVHLAQAAPTTPPRVAQPTEDAALLAALLGALPPPKVSDADGRALRVLEYAAPGHSLLAAGLGGGVLLSQGEAGASPEGILVIDVSEGLPSLDAVAALFLRHPLASGLAQPTLERLSAAPALALDLVAIGEGPHAGDVLSWLGRLQPRLVRLAGGGADASPAPTGYHPVAARAGAVWHAPVAATESEPRPTVRTFDVFDTLVARRCGLADGIFLAMAKAIDSPAFVSLRKQAEAEVYGDAYTLDDIYVRFAQLAGMSLEDAALLRNLELHLEVEAAIPIAENLAEVGPDDVLVSDMYLSEEQIRRILAAAGFRGRNPLMVRSRGKHTGQSWTELTARLSIAQHLGDNARADVEMARRGGVPARLTSVSQPTAMEVAVADSGFPSLANAMREARLRLHEPEPELAEAQRLQTQINFPLLTIAGLHLGSVVAAEGYDVALMAGRDCNLWIGLVERLAAAGRFAARPVYLEACRRLLRRPSPAYARYFDALRGERSVFVDLVGTGLSAQIFAQASGLGLARYLLNDIGGGDYARAESARLGVPVRVAEHHLARRPVANADLLEVVNYDTCGTLQGMVEVGGVFVPVRAAPDVAGPTLRRVQAMHAAFAVCLEALSRNGVDTVDDPGLLQAAGGGLLDFLYAQDAHFLMEHHRRLEALAVA